MNPVKSPLQMLYELAGLYRSPMMGGMPQAQRPTMPQMQQPAIPHMAGGKSVPSADDLRAEMAVKGFTPKKLASKAAGAVVPTLNAYQLYEMAKDIRERAKRGDYPGAAISTIGGAGYGIGMIPGAGSVGTGVGMSADVINLLRDLGIDLSDDKTTLGRANPLYTTSGGY